MYIHVVCMYICTFVFVFVTYLSVYLFVDILNTDHVNNTMLLYLVMIS